MIVNAEDAYKSGPWCKTQNGVFHLDAPTFDIHDIAHALSLNCRFNGHTDYFYSVAQHSLMVAQLMEVLDLGNPLEGLLHDATEAYMSDVPAPFKQCLPDWSAIDKRLELAMREYFDLPLVKTEGCKKADWLAVFIEAAILIPGAGAEFEDPHGFRDEALALMGDNLNTWWPRQTDPFTARDWFLKKYFDLTGGP